MKLNLYKVMTDDKLKLKVIVKSKHAKLKASVSLYNVYMLWF